MYVVCVIRLVGPVFGRTCTTYNVYSSRGSHGAEGPRVGICAGERDETRPHNWRNRPTPYVFAYVSPREFSFSTIVRLNVLRVLKPRSRP